MQKIFSLKTAQSNVFSSPVSVEIYSNGGSFESLMQQVNVQYSIDIEYRKFGIKDISVIPIGTIELQVVSVDENDQHGQPIALQIDTSQLKIETTSGRGVLAQSLSIWLDKSGQIDYNNSEITFVFFGR